MSRKIFVGSLPHGVQAETLKEEFSQYGQVEDVFVKQGCDVGRQWAFVTFADNAQAQAAKDASDRILTFPGQDRPCDVMVAKNQGMYGQVQGGGSAPAPQSSTTLLETAKKIFVGSLPDNIQDSTLRAEFSKYGTITDTFLKTGCDTGRQWGFVTFSTAEEAQQAKVTTDRILTFPGSARACEVTLAKNQGPNGTDPLLAGVHIAPGPKKVFVGSLPDGFTTEALKAEFGRYGTIVDTFLKTPCDPGRQWAFITFATPEQANACKDQADRVHVVAGHDKPCEVMLAKNQGRNGTEPLHTPTLTTLDYGLAAAQAQLSAAAMIPGLYAAAGLAQPPQVAVLGAPLQQTMWREYTSVQGLPYYHNHATGVTQWEKPPELSMPPVTAVPAIQPLGALPAASSMQAISSLQPAAAAQPITVHTAAPLQTTPVMQTVPIQSIQASPAQTVQALPQVQTVPIQQATDPSSAPTDPRLRAAPY